AALQPTSVGVKVGRSVSPAAVGQGRKLGQVLEEKAGEFPGGLPQITALEKCLLALGGQSQLGRGEWTGKGGQQGHSGFDAVAGPHQPLATIQQQDHGSQEKKGSQNLVAAKKSVHQAIEEALVLQRPQAPVQDHGGGKAHRQRHGQADIELAGNPAILDEQSVFSFSLGAIGQPAYAVPGELEIVVVRLAQKHVHEDAVTGHDQGAVAANQETNLIEVQLPVAPPSLGKT